MRSWFGIVVSAIVAIIGSTIWAVSLAVYQQRMEPTGLIWLADGTRYARIAENNTYWPRELRELAIVLALGAVLAIGRAGVRAWACAAALGLVWLAADLWLDRIDVDGRAAAAWLAVAGCVAAAAAALVARPGRPSERGALLAGGTAAFLAVAPAAIVTPWDEPVTRSDQVAIENAVTLMDGTLAIALAALAVTLLAPVMVTTRSRRLVPAFAAVIVAVVVLGVTAPAVTSSVPIVLLLVAPVSAVMIVAAAQGVSLRRLLVVGGVGLALTLLSFCVLLSVGTILGRWLTRLAGDPPVNGADTDLSISLTATLLGLALSAAALVAVRIPVPSTRQPIAAGPSSSSWRGQ